MCELLDGIFGNQTGVPGSAASSDDDALGFEKTLPVINETGQGDIVHIDVHAASHRIGQGARLLEDLFEHEVRITAFLQLRERHLQLLDFRRLVDVVDGGDVYLFAQFEAHYLLVLDIDDLVRIFDNRCSIGSEEELVLTDTDNERTTLSGCDDTSRVITV